MEPSFSSDWRALVRQYAFPFAVLLLLWLLLAGSLRWDELLAGIVVAFIVVVVARPRLGIFDGVILRWESLLYLGRYLREFFSALVRANIDVARRLLHPSLPIRPAVVEVRTRLVSPLGKLLLANSITLTPGTLVVDVQDDVLLVHWIDCPPGTDLEYATRTIAEAFETHISGFLK